MSSPRRSGARAYARAIECSWSELCGRQVILSPRDWGLIEDWHARDIPLQIIAEAIAHAAELRARGKGGRSTPRGLSYIADAVEDSWAAVLEGRTAGGTAAQDTSSSREPAIAGWRRRMIAEGADSALRDLLAELIAAYESGEPAGELDGRLDAGLPGSVPRELLLEVEEEVSSELRPYRGRMAPGVYESTMRRTIVARLRRRLQLPELAVLL